MWQFADITAVTANPTSLGVIAILMSTFGTLVGLYFNYNKDKRVAHKDDLRSAYERLDALDAKLTQRDKMIDEQANLIRQLRDQLAERDRTIEDQKSQLTRLRNRVSKLERQQRET